MKKVVVSLVSAAALATITASMAGGTNSTVASTNDFFNNDAAGIYVGGGLGFSHVHNDAVKSSDRNHFAFGVDAGYQFNQYLAAELGYIDLARPSNEHDYLFDLVAKGIIPVSTKFNVFGKAGLARITASSTAHSITKSVSKYTGIVGAGVAYKINQSLSVDAQVLHTFKSKNSDVTVYPTTIGLVGLSYKFSAI